MLKLIGVYLSPYTRRVGISLKVLGLPFEHLALSNLTQADEIRKYNPMVRVPALVCEDGATLIESSAILDYLDEQVPAERRLVPASGDARREVLQLVAWSTSACEKMVVNHYELNRRPEDKIFRDYTDRNMGQIAAALHVVEDRARETGGWLFGDRISQADITAVSVFEFGKRALPQLFEDAPYPALEALCVRAAEAHPAFGETRA